MKRTLDGSWTRRAPTCMLAVLISLTGCSKSGPKLASVSGRVTLDGQPMDGARLRFQPETPGGAPSYGSTDADGQYKLGYKRGEFGALVGWHVVRIESGSRMTNSDGKTVRPPELPAQYNSKSDLRREVKSDEDNEIDFELTTSAK